jgi:hypothetical protein
MIASYGKLRLKGIVNLQPTIQYTEENRAVFNVIGLNMKEPPRKRIKITSSLNAISTHRSTYP